MQDLALQFDWWRAIYHFVKPHHILRQKIETPNGRLRYRARTPAQTAGLTRRRWSVLELLSCPPSAALVGRIDNKISSRNRLAHAHDGRPFLAQRPHSRPIGFPELPTTSKSITPGLPHAARGLPVDWTIRQSSFPGPGRRALHPNGGRRRLRASRSLGEFESEASLTHDACWGLRRGRLHIHRATEPASDCPHIGQGVPIDYVCLPLGAQGESIGLLHLQARPAEPFTEDRLALADALGEHVALALANLRLREALQQQALRDPLTGLFNRRYLEETLPREIQRTQRRQSSLALILCDVDHFKQINDTHGHEAGDVVLRDLGRFLQSQVRGADVAGRRGVRDTDG